MSYFSNIQQIQTWGWQRRFNLLRLAVVFLVLLVSVLLAYYGSLRRLQLILVLVIGVGAVFLLLRYPPLGLLIAIVTGFTVPFVGPGGLNATMLFVALLLALWLLDMVVQQRQIGFVSSKTMLPLLGLIVVSFLAFGVGQVPWFLFARQAPLDAQIGGLAVFVLSAAVFLLVANQIENTRWLKMMLVTVFVLGTIFIVGRTTPVLGRLSRTIIIRSSVGGVFWAWFAPLAFSQAVFNKKLHPIWRVVLGLLVALSLYVGFVINGNWKSGWMPAFIALGAIVAFRSWKAGLALLLVGAIPTAYVIINSLADDAYSFSTRIDAWLIMFEIIKADPFFGLGFANYYWYTPLFRIRGYDVNFNSHNNYVDIVAQTGIIGLIFFLWLFWELGRVAWRLRDRVAKGGFDEAYVYGAFGGLMGTLAAAMLGDWVLSFVYNVGLVGFRTGMLAWIFLGGLVVLEKKYRHGNK